MHLLKKILIITILSCISLQCNSKTNEKKLNYGFSSLDEFTTNMTSFLEKNNKDLFIYFYLSREEFDQVIYSNLPEANQSAPMPKNDYWLLSAYENEKAANFYFQEAKKSKWKITKIHKPEKVNKYEDVTVYKVSFDYTFELNGEEKVGKNSDLFRAIVEHNGIYRLWSSGLD